jgi:hypothetical protein
VNPAVTREEALAHFGVKGMKWGVRKAVDDTPNPTFTSRMRANDQKTFGKRGVRRINRRLNEGLTRDEAHQKEQDRRNWIRLGVAGSLFAAALLADSGGAVMTSIHNRAETNRGRAAIPAIASTEFKIPFAKQRSGVYNITTLK